MSQQQEEWRDIRGFEGRYEVSNVGRVRRLNPHIGRGPYRYFVCSPVHKGYVRVQLSPPRGKGRLYPVHRLVLAAFVGPMPDGMTVNHKNGIKHDNRVENLEYMTIADNLRHSFRVLGRRVGYGETHSQSKLTDEAVRHIRSLPPVRSSVLARTYGVGVGTINDIRRRVIWKHVV